MLRAGRGCARQPAHHAVGTGPPRAAPGPCRREQRWATPGYGAAPDHGARREVGAHHAMAAPGRGRTAPSARGRAERRTKSRAAPRLRRAGGARGGCAAMPWPGRATAARTTSRDGAAPGGGQEPRRARVWGHSTREGSTEPGGGVTATQAVSTGRREVGEERDGEAHHGGRGGTDERRQSRGGSERRGRLGKERERRTEQGRERNVRRGDREDERGHGVGAYRWGPPPGDGGGNRPCAQRAGDAVAGRGGERLGHRAGPRASRPKGERGGQAARQAGPRARCRAGPRTRGGGGWAARRRKRGKEGFGGIFLFFPFNPFSNLCF
jgi:hypothetical protein